MKRAVLVAVCVVAVVVLACLAWAGWVRTFTTGVITNSFVGSTEADLRATYGSPTSDEPGYQRLGAGENPRLPDGNLRTMRFSPGGLLHPEGGTLVVWLREEQTGEWRCFESCWYADGVMF